MAKSRDVDRGDRNVKYLVVNADDALLSPGVTEGILQAHRDGIVTSASVFTNFDQDSGSIKKLKSAPDLGLGIHLNCVSGRPVSNPGDVVSLVTSSGTFHRPGKFVLRSLAGFVRYQELKREFSAQISRFIGWGLEPTHLDVHHHGQVFPPVVRALEDCAIKFHIPWIRLPSVAVPSSMSITGLLRSRDLPVFIASRLMGNGVAHVRRRGLNCAHRLYGVLETGLLDFFLLYRIIDQLPSGISEIMCHPANCDTLLKERSSLGESRERELNALLNPGLKRLIRDRGIELTNYGRL